MKSQFVKFKEAVDLLHRGWEIFTSRGNAPWKPIYYHLYNGDTRRAIHFKTVEKLISENIISGKDSQHDKYKLKHEATK